MRCVAVGGRIGPVMEYEDIRSDLGQIIQDVADIKSTMRRIAELLEQQAFQQGAELEAARDLLQQSKDLRGQ